mgnify:FL=1
MDNTSATQAEVDQALNNLQNAVNGLVKNTPEAPTPPADNQGETPAP